MAEPIDLIITEAGLNALVDAQNGETDEIKVVEVGLTRDAFDAAPTLTALPGEFKRVATFAGQAVDENIIHMTALDTSVASYELRGLGLFLEDGTLFASFGQEEPILCKVASTHFLLAFDVRLSGAVASDITFGDATFLYPPATEEVKGVAELATQEEVDEGLDHERIVTPLTLAGRLGAFLDSVNAALAAFAARTITGTGLASGGGDLSADRTIHVAPASGSDILAGSAADKAVTPAAIAAVPQVFGGACSIVGLGGAILKTGTLTVGFPGGGSHTFPTAFPTGCHRVLLTPMGNPNDGDEKDETWWVASMSATGFSVSAGDDGTGITFAYLAIGN